MNTPDIPTHSTTARETRSAMFAMSSSCLKCNKPFDPFAASAAPDSMHVDHVIPSSKGGVDHLSNYQPLCTRCNTSKGNRSNADYRTDAMRAKYPKPAELIRRQEEARRNQAAEQAERAKRNAAAHAANAKRNAAAREAAERAKAEAETFKTPIDRLAEAFPPDNAPDQAAKRARADAVQADLKAKSDREAKRGWIFWAVIMGGFLGALFWSALQTSDEMRDCRRGVRALPSNADKQGLLIDYSRCDGL